MMKHTIYISGATKNPINLKQRYRYFLYVPNHNKKEYYNLYFNVLLSFLLEFLSLPNYGGIDV